MLLRDQHVTASNTVGRLSRKLRIFAAAQYWMKRAAWNEGYHSLDFTGMDAFFAKIFAKNDFHISDTVTLIFDLMTEKLNVVRCSAFELTVTAQARNQTFARGGPKARVEWRRRRGGVWGGVSPPQPTRGPGGAS